MLQLSLQLLAAFKVRLGRDGVAKCQSEFFGPRLPVAASARMGYKTGVEHADGLVIAAGFPDSRRWVFPPAGACRRVAQPRSTPPRSVPGSAQAHGVVIRAECCKRNRWRIHATGRMDVVNG